MLTLRTGEEGKKKEARDGQVLHETNLLKHVSGSRTALVFHHGDRLQLENIIAVPELMPGQVRLF